MAGYRARQRRDAHRYTSFVIERMPLGKGPSKSLPPRYLRCGWCSGCAARIGGRAYRKVIAVSAEMLAGTVPYILWYWMELQTRSCCGNRGATHQRAHIRVIFERHESLPMASGSVALSGAMGEVDPEMKVGSIVLMGGLIEQTLAVRVQPSPDKIDVAKQLHVKPPIAIESTSPTAANTACLRWSIGEANATGRAPTVAVRGCGRGEGCGAGRDGAGGADRRKVGVGSTPGVSIQNTDGRRLGASFGVG
jgi:hypothetical protein